MWFRHAVFLLSSCFLSSAVHEKWGFCGQEAEIDASVHEKGRFCGQKRFPIESGMTDCRLAYARTCYSSLRLSDLVGYLDTTDRVPESTGEVAHADIAAVQAEVVGVVAVRS